MAARPERWVVFDLGETLVDETANWARWADHLGVPHLTFFGVLGAVIAARRHHADALAYFGAPRSASGPEWGFTADDLYPDALPVLAALRERGYRLAVVANQPEGAEPFLATLPVDRYATSARWGVTKPDPRFFARLLDEIGAAPDDVAYVGDRVDNDVLPAKAAGLVAVHVRRGPWGVLHHEWPEAASADLRLDSLAPLPDALAALGFVG